MNAIQLAADMVKDHEGLALNPYVCTAGKLSIGYGRNLADRGITKDEAEYLLRNDLRIAESDAIDIAGPVWAALTEARKAVLIDMAFNLGRARLGRFVKMWTHIRAGNYPLAAVEMMDSLWARQVKRRAEKLSEIMARGTP